MTDEKILDLFFERCQQGIAETREKYGDRLFRLANSLLDNRLDAEECVSDTLLAAWNAIPPNRPLPLLPWLFATARHIAVLLTEEEALQYYTMYNDVMEARKPYLSANKSSDSWFISTEELVPYVGWTSARFCLNGENAFAPCSLCHAAEVLAIGKVEGLDFSLLPMPSIDGSTVAEITYFGAVSAGCEHPEEAYEFLRMFLTPEVQFQKTLSSGVTHLRSDDCAWPVRITGSVEGKYRVALEWAGIQEPVRDRSAFFTLELTDDDLPFIREPIDHVRFSTPFSYEFFDSVDDLNDDLLVDNIEQKAADLITFAKYHIAES